MDNSDLLMHQIDSLRKEIESAGDRRQPPKGEELKSKSSAFEQFKAVEELKINYELKLQGCEQTVNSLRKANAQLELEIAHSQETMQILKREKEQNNREELFKENSKLKQKLKTLKLSQTKEPEDNAMEEFNGIYQQRRVSNPEQEAENTFSVTETPNRSVEENFKDLKHGATQSIEEWNRDLKLITEEIKSTLTEDFPSAFLLKLEEKFLDLHAQIGAFHTTLAAFEVEEMRLRRQLRAKDREIGRLSTELDLQRTQPQRLNLHSLVAQKDELTSALLSKDHELSQFGLQVAHYKELLESKATQQERSLFTIELGKMKTFRDKALLDYQQVLTQLKMAKDELALTQESFAEKQLALYSLFLAVTRDPKVPAESKALVESLYFARTPVTARVPPRGHTGNSLSQNSL